MNWIWLNRILVMLVCAYAFYWFAFLVYTRYRFIMLGKKSEEEVDVRKRLGSVLAEAFGHKKLLKDKKSGIMHLVMFYGFLILQVGAIDLIGKGLAPGWHLPLGPLYPFFLWIQETTVVFVLLATAYAGYRRYIEKLPRLKRNWKASLVLWFIGSLMGTVLLATAMESVWREYPPSAFQPVSSLLAKAFAGLTPEAAKIWFYLFWWLHLLILLAFLLYLPQSKHSHLLFAPINLLLRRSGPPGRLRAIDFEDEELETYGVGRVEDFTRFQLIDLYACVECGRCTSMCPASETGKTLSPMELIIKLRDHLTEKGSAVISRSPWLPAFPSRRQWLPLANRVGSGQKEAASADDLVVQLVGEVISEEELWACTTCRNCEDQCPVGNEHVDKIIDMRRYLVLTEGSIPREMARFFQNIERHSNPWGIDRRERIQWREGLDIEVPTVEETEEFEYLFFVGSMGSFDSRSRKVAQTFAKIMHKAGIKFAILGNEERSSGDTARRMGNEFLFQQLCRENIAMFQKYGVKKIVTICPHTYNTFKNEYPEFGLEAEVYHHTELIWKWLKEGRLQPIKEVKEAVAYHDSCYLGRYNGIFDVPRKILQSVPGVEILEMARSREDAMCCGAGGGMMWLEETQGKRVNVARTEQALRLNPTTIASNCPYCLTMLSDGTKAKGVQDKVKTMDIAEIVLQSL